MKKIAVVENGYIRDAQIYIGAPSEITDDNQAWENKYSDLKYPCHYIGIIECESDEEILEKAAELEGIHPGVISLIDIRTKESVVGFKSMRFTMSDEEIHNKTIIQFYDTVAIHLGIDIASVRYDCRCINIASNIQDEIYKAYEMQNPDVFTNRRNDAICEVTMMLANAGSKANSSFPDNTVEIENGFFIWQTDSPQSAIEKDKDNESGFECLGCETFSLAEDLVLKTF